MLLFIFTETIFRHHMAVFFSKNESFLFTCKLGTSYFSNKMRSRDHANYFYTISIVFFKLPYMMAVYFSASETFALRSHIQSFLFSEIIFCDHMALLFFQRTGASFLCIK